jgi:hypothetical protein
MLVIIRLIDFDRHQVRLDRLEAIHLEKDEQKLVIIPVEAEK